MSVKRDTTRPYVLRPSSPIVVRLTWLVAFVFAMIAIAVTAYWVGYGVAWQKTESVYNDVIILEAKADELKVEIRQLRNYAVLIDALALQGEGAYTLQHDLMMIPDTVHDTTICTLQVSTPAQAGKEK